MCGLGVVRHTALKASCITFRVSALYNIATELDGGQKIQDGLMMRFLVA